MINAFIFYCAFCILHSLYLFDSPEIHNGITACLPWSKKSVECADTEMLYGENRLTVC